MYRFVLAHIQMHTQIRLSWGSPGVDLEGGSIHPRSLLVAMTEWKFTSVFSKALVYSHLDAVS